MNRNAMSGSVTCGLHYESQLYANFTGPCHDTFRSANTINKERLYLTVDLLNLETKTGPASTISCTHCPFFFLPRQMTMCKVNSYVTLLFIPPKCYTDKIFVLLNVNNITA